MNVFRRLPNGKDWGICVTNNPTINKGDAVQVRKFDKEIVTVIVDEVIEVHSNYVIATFKNIEVEDNGFKFLMVWSKKGAIGKIQVAKRSDGGWFFRSMKEKQIKKWKGYTAWRQIRPFEVVEEFGIKLCNGELGVSIRHPIETLCQFSKYECHTPANLICPQQKLIEFGELDFSKSPLENFLPTDYVG